jgi:hypothetical protein
MNSKSYSKAVAARQAVGSNPTSPIKIISQTDSENIDVAVVAAATTEIKYKGVWHKRLYKREFF